MQHSQKMQNPKIAKKVNNAKKNVKMQTIVKIGENCFTILKLKE